MRAVRATTASSNTSVGSRSGFERLRINAAGYGGPALANHGERHPWPGNCAPAKSEEPVNRVDARGAHAVLLGGRGPGWNRGAHQGGSLISLGTRRSRSRATATTTPRHWAAPRFPDCWFCVHLCCEL